MRRYVLLGLVLALGLIMAVNAPVGGQRLGGKLIIAQGTDAESVDPINFTASPTASIMEHIIQTLVRLDIEDRDGQLETTPKGVLAESWSVSPDGKTWTFKLRSGIKFHDGTDLTADVVKLNLERALHPDCAAPFRGAVLGRLAYSPASATTGEVAKKNAIVWRANLLLGPEGNNVSVAITSGAALGVSVSGSAITVTAPAGTTAAAVIKAVNENAAANKLVWASNAPGSDGSGVVEPVAATRLAGFATSVEAPDASTVRINLASPFAPLLQHLAHTAATIVSAKRIREAIAAAPPCGKGLQDQVAGTGPFMLKEWKRGERMILVKNPNYWEKDAAGRPLPYVDELEWRVIPDDAARMIELERGTVHIAVRVPPLDVPRLQRDPNIVLDFTTSVRTIYIGMNVRERIPDKPDGAPNPLADKRVRQALNYCVDKEAIVKTIMGGQARVSDAPIVPQVFGYAKVGPYPFDPARAAALLREAGVTLPLKLKLHHPRGRYVRDVQIAQAVQAMLGTCRIEVELIPMEFVSFLALINKAPSEAEHQLYLLGWGTITLDADYGLYSLFHSSQWPPGPFNRGYYKNERVDALLQQGREEPDPAKRKAIYAEAQKLIWEDAPWIFSHSESQITGIRKNVKNAEVHVTERLILWKTWLE
ncbi:MAG: ABC transporter substrate-binding protein [Candidatus Bipolaricaulota bacterium]|nr:ABC transporter substrate-binding protein [Candidatus Bipolaricaulota bacterium]MDW8030830.1 ABC transporter substrate-binding protein [Candidatus Bipolaricaulota bacterium]